MQAGISAKNIIFTPPKVSAFSIFFSQFKSPLIYVLLFAGLVTLLLNEFSDSVVIFVAVIVNAILGFVQEYQARNTLQHLNKLLSSKAYLWKNGKVLEINTEDVQIGDIVVLAKDYSIPADGEIIESESLEINEAILTGESLPVIKKVKDGIFTGTIITAGIGKMRVTKIGTDTKIGQIGKNVLASKEQQTPLQRQIAKLASSLTKIVGLLVIVIFVLGLMLKYDPREMLINSIAIAVAAIPEGMVITLTVILTIGMSRILRKKAIVRQLISAETLGSVSVICVDKTGTITNGSLKVVESDFINTELGLLSVILCNNQIDSLETSMLDWVESSTDPLAKETMIKSENMPRLDGMSFSHGSKFTATLNHFEDKSVLFIFGAPEKVMEKTNLSHDLKDEWIRRIEAHAQFGRKIVGFAYKYIQSQKLQQNMIENLEWNGILVYEDTIRKGINETIKYCLQAGITVKMITGDYLATAKYVGEQVGLIPIGGESNKYILTGDQLKELHGIELTNAVKHARVFARIDPLEKHTIVDILQESGEVVAMTGDGVNDAPALKSADIGIVVNEASDISKNTADIVLLDSNFATIVHAVKEGRIIFSNIQKTVVFLLSGSFTEIILIVGALVLNLPVPLLAVQILWVNLIEDSFPALALSFERQAKGVMGNPPRKKNSPIINFGTKLVIGIYVLVSDGLLLGLFSYLSNTTHDIGLIRTIMFLGIGIDSLLSIYAFKSLRENIFSYNPFSNWFLNISVVLGLLMLVSAIYLPVFNNLLSTVALPLEIFLLTIGLGILDLILVELIKFFVIKFQNNSAV